MLLRRKDLKNDNICANMLSSTSLSSIAEDLMISFNLDEKESFKALARLNALACGDRYGIEVHNSLSKISKFYTPIKNREVNNFEVAGYVASFVILLNDYLSDNTKLTKYDNFIKDSLYKLYRKYDREGIYRNKEFKYNNNIIYYYEENSKEYKDFLEKSFNY